MKILLLLTILILSVTLVSATNFNQVLISEDLNNDGYISVYLYTNTEYDKDIYLYGTWTYLEYWYPLEGEDPYQEITIGLNVTKGYNYHSTGTRVRYMNQLLDSPIPQKVHLKWNPTSELQEQKTYLILNSNHYKQNNEYLHFSLEQGTGTRLTWIGDAYARNRAGRIWNQGTYII